MVIHRYGLLVLSYLVKKQFDRTKSSLPDKTKTIVFAFFEGLFRANTNFRFCFLGGLDCSSQE